MPREALRIVACGKQGVGKSWETMRMLYEAVAGTGDAPPRKCLIFDVNNEYEEFEFQGRMHRIKSIALSDITLFTVHSICEIRRITPYFDNGQPMTPNDMQTVLEGILKVFNNGIMLVEDPNKYVSDNMPSDLIGMLVSTRHRSTDMIIHYQNIGRAGHPKILGNTSLVRLHKTNDSVVRHKGKFEEKTMMLQIAEHIVNTRYDNGDERFFLYVDIDRNKIRGTFKYSEAEIAVHEYVSDNYKTVVRGIMAKRDLKTGKLLYKEEEAMRIARTNLLKTYFCFPSVSQ